MLSRSVLRVIQLVGWGDVGAVGAAGGSGAVDGATESPPGGGVLSRGVCYLVNGEHK